MFDNMGERIKYARRKSQMKQAELANFVGVSTGTIGQYESNSSSPSVEKLGKIAEACSVTMDWLTKGGVLSVNTVDDPSDTLHQKIQQMEESFRAKEQQYLEIIRNLSLGKARVIEAIAAVIATVTDSVTYQRIRSQKLASR